MPSDHKVPTRKLGDYFKSGDWSDYWTTAIGYTAPPHILRIRGYPVEELISKLSYAEVLYLTIKGELPSKAQARAFDAVLTSLPDHSLVSAHAMAARYVASAHSESVIPGIAAGMLCVGMHTISPQDSGEVILAAYKQMKSHKLSRTEAARKVVKQHIESKTYIPGLGHPTYKDYDPRAQAVEQVAKEVGIWGDKAELFEAIRREFNEQTKRSLPMNIDGALACVLTELDFSPRQMAGVAVVCILPGLIAHVIEEIEEGVPLRLLPDHQMKYTGPEERHVP